MSAAVLRFALITVALLYGALLAVEITRLWVDDVHTAAVQADYDAVPR
jgi:hypothetical protein